MIKSIIYLSKLFSADRFCLQSGLVYFYLLMPPKKILWLCSWYPGRTDPFNGDFIQRHARAASLYNDITVIHAAGERPGSQLKTNEEVKRTERLTEQIVYFKKGLSFWGKILGHYRWLKSHRRAIKKYISENGKPDLVHVHVIMKAGIAALWLKRKFNVPFVITEHWGIYNEVAKDNYQKRNRVFRNYTKRIISQASLLVSVSRYLAEGIAKMVIPKKYEVVPNVADTDLFFYKERSREKFRFIHVSNMVPLKNAEGILRTFQIVQKRNNAELVMVGDTDISIRNYAASLDLLNKTVFFHGEVKYEMVAKEMQESHCLLLFSNIENSPCVIGEALCCGLPVIATTVGGIPELVNANNGLLIEPKNEQELSHAMMQMMDNYLYYDFGKIAEDAAQKFSYHAAGKKLDELYNAVLSSGGNH
jgi:glycosyltransferase involved in cell wall biosynthesis